MNGNRRFQISVDDQYVWINGKPIPKTLARILAYLVYAAAVFAAVMLFVFVILPLLGIVLAFGLVVLLLGAAAFFAAPLIRSIAGTFRTKNGSRNIRPRDWD